MLETHTQLQDCLKELNNMKLEHVKKLSKQKLRHISEEQSLRNSYNLEYKNTIREMLIKHLGNDLASEDLQSIFEQALIDERFKLEKEYIELERRYEEKRIHALSETIHTCSDQTNISDMIPAKKLALIIFNKIQSNKNPKQIPNECIIKGNNKKHNTKPDRKIISENIEEKLPKSERKQNHKQTRKKKIPSTIKKHIQARTRLQKSVFETEEFVHQLKKQLVYECSSSCFE